jgi:hypothetical protein
LRAVALAAWALGGWCVIYGARLLIAGEHLTTLLIFVELLALLLLAVGIAFWLLAGDRRAGIVFDAKGLLLNLGHSSAFIAWENIERVGETSHRSSLFDLGSRRQIGIALRDVGAYVQTYEQRLPAGRGALARAVRLLDRALRPFRRYSDRPLVAQMALFRARTGYDVLIPETLLGGRAEMFAELVDSYRLHPEDRRTLDGMAWAG